MCSKVAVAQNDMLSFADVKALNLCWTQGRADPKSVKNEFATPRSGEGGAFDSRLKCSAILTPCCYSAGFIPHVARSHTSFACHHFCLLTHELQTDAKCRESKGLSHGSSGFHVGYATVLGLL